MSAANIIEKFKAIFLALPTPQREKVISLAANELRRRLTNRSIRLRFSQLKMHTNDTIPCDDFWATTRTAIPLTHPHTLLLSISSQRYFSYGTKR
jgi:hypothetical protein